MKNIEILKIQLCNVHAQFLIPCASGIRRRGASTSAAGATVAKGAEGTVAVLVGQFAHVTLKNNQMLIDYFNLFLIKK